jgi:protein arginine kinase activator
MLCRVCEVSEATVHLTLISPGEKLLKVDLCEACAKAKGVAGPSGFSSAEVLAGIQALGQEGRVQDQ